MRPGAETLGLFVFCFILSCFVLLTFIFLLSSTRHGKYGNLESRKAERKKEKGKEG